MRKRKRRENGPQTSAFDKAGHGVFIWYCERQSAWRRKQRTVVSENLEILLNGSAVRDGECVDNGSDGVAAMLKGNLKRSKVK